MLAWYQNFVTIGQRKGVGKGGNGTLNCGNLRKMYNYAKTGGSIKMILSGVAEIVNASLVLEFGDNRPREGRGLGALSCGNLGKIHNYAKTGDPIKMILGVSQRQSLLAWY